jgi:hypothetical protein
VEKVGGKLMVPGSPRKQDGLVEGGRGAPDRCLP